MKKDLSVADLAKSTAPLPHGIVVMGVCGTGKSTIGIQLADTLDWTYADADDFHPAPNVAKMRAGTPLSDEDRAPWLTTLRDHLRDHPRTVLACSALKARYREILRAAAPDIRFIFLQGDRDLLSSRLGARAGHYMPSSLLDSQLAALETPSATEAIICDIALPPAAIVASAHATLVASKSP